MVQEKTFFVNCVHQFRAIKENVDNTSIISNIGINYKGYELCPKYDNGKKIRNPYHMEINEILLHDYDKSLVELINKYEKTKFWTPIYYYDSWVPDDRAPYRKEKEYIEQYQEVLQEIKRRKFPKMYENRLIDRSKIILPGILMYPDQSKRQLTKVSEIIHEILDKNLKNVKQYVSFINDKLYGWFNLLEDYYGIPWLSEKVNKGLVVNVINQHLDQLSEISDPSKEYYLVEKGSLNHRVVEIRVMGTEEVESILKRELEVLNIYMDIIGK